uniref:BAR domain-containing protein n=1 Tax=Elaeophora elaphi TaxID=1147741 RepID=A0A0R3RI59_9BILA
MFRRLKQNVMVKLDMAKQTEFPGDVARSITFCEQSKLGVTAITKAVELMIANFNATGMTPADGIANVCTGLAAKTDNKKFNKVMKNVEEALEEIAKTERLTAKQVESKIFNSWSRAWLNENLKTYLEDINQLKKRRLDKDGLAQAANKHSDDEIKQEKSKEADERYEEQLSKVRQNIYQFPAHYKRTAETVRELISILANHFDKCANMTSNHLKNAKNA